MSPLKDKSETLRKALGKLRLRQVDFAAITGRSTVQIGKMCNARAPVPDYVWGFILMLQAVEKYGPDGWLRKHVKRTREAREARGL